MNADQIRVGDEYAFSLPGFDAVYRVKVIEEPFMNKAGHFMVLLSDVRASSNWRDRPLLARVDFVREPWSAYEARLTEQEDNHA